MKKVQEKINRIVGYMNEFYNDVSEDRIALNTISKEIFLNYISTIDILMEKRAYKISKDQSLTPEIVLRAITEFIESEKKELKSNTHCDKYEFIDVISKIIKEY